MWYRRGTFKAHGGVFNGLRHYRVRAHHAIPSNGRVVSLLFTLGGSCFNLVNTYAPTALTDRKTFFESFDQYFFPADHTILGGDFNCYEKDLDKFGRNISLASYLTDFRKNFNFIDIWRKKHPRTHKMSWFNSNFTIGSRLDKFFVTPV